MSRNQNSKPNQAIRRTTIKRGEQTMFSLTMVTLLIAGVLVGFELFGPANKSKAKIQLMSSVIQAAPTVGAISLINSAVKDPNRPLVGIVSGHKGYDPGAVCSDGLSEVEINYVIALEVASLLGRRDIQADVLDEFDDRALTVSPREGSKCGVIGYIIYQT